MKKNFFIITAVVCGMSCTTTAYAQFKIGGKKINVNKVVQAGTDAVKAISLSDADIAAMSKEYMEWMDTHNPLTAEDGLSDQIVQIPYCRGEGILDRKSYETYGTGIFVWRK